MIDTVQAVLLFVIVLLTILFLVLGIQVFLILRDLRQTIQRTNKILDQAEILTEGISNQLSNVANIFSNASFLGVIGKIFTTFLKKRK